MRLKADTQRPPGAFQYRVPETGVMVPLGGPSSLYGCVEQVRRHYQANRLTVPAGLQEKIEDFNCRQAPPGWCNGDDRPRNLPSVVGERGTQIDTVIQGAKTIASWLIEGSVPEEQAQVRAGVCRGCPKHGDTSCPRCRSGLVSKLATMVAGALNRQPADWELPLKACGVCGCALKLKVHCKLETILKHTPPEQLMQFPAKCWVKTEQT
jgi:hypothetical protein